MNVCFVSLSHTLSRPIPPASLSLSLSLSHTHTQAHTRTLSGNTLITKGIWLEATFYFWRGLFEAKAVNEVDAERRRDHGRGHHL